MIGIKKTVVIGAALGVGAAASGDILITLMSDANNATIGTAIGTYDTTGGLEFAGEAPGNGATFFADQALNSLRWISVSTPATETRTLVLPLTSGPGPIMSREIDAATEDSGWDNADDIFVSLTTIFGNSGDGRIRTFDGNNTGTLDEEFAYASVSFDTFNHGTWDFGSFGGAPNDGIRLQIIPAPASAVLLGLGGMTAFHRRRGAF